MAAFAIHREAQRLVVRVHTLGIVLRVTAVTGIGSIAVASIVAGRTIIRYHGVCPCKGVKAIMVEGGRHPGRFRVAALTIYRELARLVVGVRGLVVILGMAACTGIRRIVVVAVVAACTVIRSGGVRPIQHVIIVMDVKRCGVPARPGSMASRAIRRQPQHLVIGVGAVVKINSMTSLTIRWRSLVSIGMAQQTVCIHMCARKGEIGAVVVKSAVGAARRVASQAGCIFISITAHANVPLVRFGVDMAIDAHKFGVVGGVVMAIGTLRPLAFMFPAVDRE